MDDKIKHIIDSGLLEAYFLGLTDDAQSNEIGMLLEKYPELRTRQEAFDALMLDMTSAISQNPPTHLKDKIQKSIREDNLATENSKEVVDIPKKSFLNKWFPIAASILLIGFAWVAYTNFKTANDLSLELAEVRKSLKVQKIQNLEMSSQLSKLADEFAFINNAHTKKYNLEGNIKAKDLKMIAYWNTQSQKSMVSIDAYPKLNPNQCLQMWADVDGKMISVGILDEKQSYASIDFLENATSLNITIEPKGGSDHPTVSDLVANVFI